MCLSTEEVVIHVHQMVSSVLSLQSVMWSGSMDVVFLSVGEATLLFTHPKSKQVFISH